MMGWGMGAAAFLAFGRMLWILHHYQAFESRRGLMGCEVARQVLDLMGHSQFSVKQLLLKEEYHKGTSLLANAASAREAVAVVRLSDLWRVASVRRLRHLLNVLILPAWLFLILGRVVPELGFLMTAGLLILGSVFFFGILDFGRDLERQHETLELLKKTGCFEPDEIIKLRRLLGALQLEGLAQIFKVPYEFIAGQSSKRKNRHA